jgi:hypothetical protein
MAQHERGVTRPSLLVAVALLAATFFALPSEAVVYSGALSSVDGGILGTGNWIVIGPATLDWDVTQNADGTWHYAYTFTHPPGATSHFIIETSDDFTGSDISDPSGDIEDMEIGVHHAGGGANPNMPENIYGIKFGAQGESTHIEFDSTRIPMWGDFYSKDGTAGGYGMNSAWNAGFTSPDWDPDLPPQHGSIEHHILVPDTYFTPVESMSWTTIKGMYR